MTHAQTRSAGSFLRTIRVRLTLWYVALLAITLVALSAFLYVSMHTMLHNGVRNSLWSSGDVLANAFLSRGPFGVRQAIASLPSGTVAILYDARGQQLIANELQEPIAPIAEAILNLAKTNRSYDRIKVPGGGESWGVLTAPIRVNGQTVATLQVARSEEEVAEALRRLLELLAIAVPAILVVAVGGGLFLAWRALQPIDKITRTVDAISADDLSQRVNYRGGQDEVGRLARTFDTMLDRVQGAFQKQRQFTADASHELRTPLAIMSSQIDVTLERQRTAQEYEEALKSLRDDASRMSQLLNQMLTLARADAGQEELSREELDLGEMAEHVVSSMQPIAEQRKVKLSYVSGTSVLVEGDQTRLTQLVINLVDNGLRYTPAGGNVDVSLAADDGWAVLRVADTGIGIPAEHLPHLFERFYRVDKARSRAEGGSGLGLSICQWIAQAHGGTISVKSEPEQGSFFYVKLPLANHTSYQPH